MEMLLGTVRKPKQQGGTGEMLRVFTEIPVLHTRKANLQSSVGTIIKESKLLAL